MGYEACCRAADAEAAMAFLPLLDRPLVRSCPFVEAVSTFAPCHAIPFLPAVHEDIFVRRSGRRHLVRQPVRWEGGREAMKRFWIAPPRQAADLTGQNG